MGSGARGFGDDAAGQGEHVVAGCRLDGWRLGAGSCQRPGGPEFWPVRQKPAAPAGRTTLARAASSARLRENSEPGTSADGRLAAAL